MPIRDWPEHARERRRGINQERVVSHDVARRRATRDREQLARYAVKASKRRAFPPWGLPAEFWAICLHPLRRGKPPGAGLGADTEPQVPEAFEQALQELFIHLRLRGAPLFASLRSNAYASDKANDEEGIVGQRILRVFDSTSMGISAGAMKRRKETSWDIPAWA